METHVFNQQRKLQEVMQEYGIELTAWEPFAEGRSDFFTNGTLAAAGVKYGKPVAQVALRFLVQRGIVIVPKSTHKERMIENFNAFDLNLTEREMTVITVLDNEKNLFFSHYDPEMVKWLTNYVK